MDVKNPHGSASNWAKASLMAGREIVVQGSQAKKGAFLVNESAVAFKDGRKLFPGSSGDEGRGQK